MCALFSDMLETGPVKVIQCTFLHAVLANPPPCHLIPCHARCCRPTSFLLLCIVGGMYKSSVHKRKMILKVEAKFHRQTPTMYLRKGVHISHKNQSDAFDDGLDIIESYLCNR